MVDTGDGIELFQPATAKKLGHNMNEFSDSFLESIKTIDGFILKNKSPSCGVKNVNVYNSFEDSRPVKKGFGIFASKLIKKFSNLPIEDEGRLRNLFIRENFLTRIFTNAEFHKVHSHGFQEISNFHTKNKLLLMAYNPENAHKMGQILSDRSKRNLKVIQDSYEYLLFETLSKTPKISLNNNVLMHALGYFSNKLTHDEKDFFLNILNENRDGRIPLLVCLNIIKLWMIRFDQDYLIKQTFFEPYPPELMQITFI